MADDYRDRVVDEVIDKVAQRQATPDDPEVIRPQAERAVDGLVDEPVQTFTPLLAENEVVSELVRGDETPPAPQA